MPRLPSRPFRSRAERFRSAAGGIHPTIPESRIRGAGREGRGIGRQGRNTGRQARNTAFFSARSCAGLQSGKTILLRYLPHAPVFAAGRALRVHRPSNSRRASQRAVPGIIMTCRSVSAGLSQLYAGKNLAEVSRNRTDRSTRGRPTGFEVLGEHQPACTSALILSNFPLTVNVGTLHCSGNCSE